MAKCLCSATGVAVLSVVFLTPTVAQAQYLDPGAGSIMIQVVIAAMVGASAAIRIYWSKISALIARRRVKH